MRDEIVSVSMPDVDLRAAAVTSTLLVRETQSRHGLSPTASAALGRLVSAAALLGATLKGKQRLSLHVRADGPLGSMTAESWYIAPGRLGVRGCAKNPHAELPLDARGKFDVAGLVGAGALHVTRSYESGQPYAGVVPLHSGEIAEDIASYLVNSEQIPSVVALGVLAGSSGIQAAGGLLAQVMPGAQERAVAELEARAMALPPITALMEKGADASALLRRLVGEDTARFHERIAVEWACRCSREKVEIALLGLGVDELRKIGREQGAAHATCDFCKEVYELDAAQIERLVTRSQKV